jgi:hypothetical protein
MRLLLFCWMALGGATAGYAARVDAMLAKFIPPDTVSLLGAQMDQLRQTPLYAKLMAQQKLPQMDKFAQETGFDPRTDVKELLLASAARPESSIVVAHGAFHPTHLEQVQVEKFEGYNIYWKDKAGFVIIDANTAVAGPVDRVKMAITEYRGGGKTVPKDLLDRARAVGDDNQVWAVSQGGFNFLSTQMPQSGNGVNFAKIFQNLDHTLFEADLRNGFKALAKGDCKTAEDAKNLSDGARGLVGFGRLSVPDNHPELLKLWDAVQVSQNDREFLIRADIPQNLIDQLVAMFQATPQPPRAVRPPHRMKPL